MNCTILSSGICLAAFYFVTAFWIAPANTFPAANPAAVVQKLPAKPKIYPPHNDYVAAFGNRFENPNGRWTMARKLYKKRMFDKLRAICEKAFSRTKSGSVKVDRAQVKLGLLNFREPEYGKMVVDVLICEIENTENEEGSKAQFFLTKGRTSDAVYYLYPLDLDRMRFMVLTHRHVTQVVDPDIVGMIATKNNLARSYYRSMYIPRYESKKYKA